jgi:hypothetical protein
MNNPLTKPLHRYIDKEKDNRIYKNNKAENHFFSITFSKSNISQIGNMKVIKRG